MVVVEDLVIVEDLGVVEDLVCVGFRFGAVVVVAVVGFAVSVSVSVFSCFVSFLFMLFCSSSKKYRYFMIGKVPLQHVCRRHFFFLCFIIMDKYKYIK